MGRRANIPLLGLVALGSAACEPGDASPAPGLEVQRLDPGQSIAGLGDGFVFLNQQIEVRFTEPVERMTLTRDTVRVIDAETGRPVDGKLIPGERSVRFVPIPPASPALDDGSFRPGRSYRLVLVGYPVGNAIKSRRGRRLSETTTRVYRAVPADVSSYDASYVSPFLPRAHALPFRPVEAGAALIPLAGRSLRLHFDRSPDPRTVGPDAFEIYRHGTDGKPESLRPAEVRLIRPLQWAGEIWSVELTFAQPPLRDPADVFYVVFTADRERALRDYHGRVVRVDERPGGVIAVRGHSGSQQPLHIEHFHDTELETLRGADVGFECVGGRAVARVCAEAGTGELGVFRPDRDVLLTPGRGFDRGDGRTVAPRGAVFDFREIHIPPHVTVTVRASGDQPIVLRACAGVRIEGRLVLDGTAFGRSASDAETIADLIQRSGCVLVAGGDLQIGAGPHDTRASVVHRQAAARRRPPPGSPLSIVAGGRIGIDGRVPRRCVLVTDAPVVDPVPGADALLQLPLTREAPAGRVLRAAARTPWFRLPFDPSDPVWVRAEGATDGIRIAVQLADYDPANPARPNPDERRHGPEIDLPLSRPLQVQGAFLRYVLRADATAGAEPPSVDRITVERSDR